MVPQDGRVGAEKRLGDGGVGDAGGVGQGAQGGPAGAVVQVVERDQQVAVRSGWQVGKRQGAHSTPPVATEPTRPTGPSRPLH